MLWCRPSSRKICNTAVFLLCTAKENRSAMVPLRGAVQGRVSTPCLVCDMTTHFGGGGVSMPVRMKRKRGDMAV